MVPVSKWCKQPGEPVSSHFSFNNPSGRQPLAFILSMTSNGDSDPDVSFDNPVIVINQQDAMKLPVSLKRNQTLYCDGKKIGLYDRNWKLLGTVSLDVPLPELENGGNEILFDGRYSGGNGPDVKIEIRAKGSAEVVPAAGSSS